MANSLYYWKQAEDNVILWEAPSLQKTRVAKFDFHLKIEWRNVSALWFEKIAHASFIFRYIRELLRNHTYSAVHQKKQQKHIWESASHFSWITSDTDIYLTTKLRARTNKYSETTKIEIFSLIFFKNSNLIWQPGDHKSILTFVSRCESDKTTTSAAMQSYVKRIRTARVSFISLEKSICRKFSHDTFAVFMFHTSSTSRGNLHCWWFAVLFNSPLHRVIFWQASSAFQQKNKARPTLIVKMK